MSNFTIRTNLLKINGAFTTNLQGRTETKRCLCIPIDNNPALFLGAKGCYLNLTAYELQNSKFDDTHYLKVSFPKEVRQQMSDEERKAQPIVGNMKPMPTASYATPVEGNSTAAPDSMDDLPF